MSTRLFNFQSAQRHFYFAARRAKLRFGAAFSHWSSLEFNPFLSHELRRSLRRRSGPFFVLWPLVFIALALALTARFGNRIAESFSDFIGQQGVNPQIIKTAFGQNEIAWMALVASGLCGYATLLYSQRAARIFLRENVSGTFNQLLLVPLTETRMALLTSAPAAFSAMALWFLLLPLWLLALATNQWSAREFFGVPLLFLMFVVRPPEWTPLYEIFPAPQGSRENREEVDDEAATVKTDEVKNDEVKIDEELDSEDEDEFPSSVSSSRTQSVLPFDPTGTITLLVVWQLAMFWARFAGFRVPPSVFNYLLPQWREFLPSPVWNLLPSLLFSWPLILVQFLATSLPFFGIALPPGLWLVPRLFLMRYAAFSAFRLTYLGSNSLQSQRAGRYWNAAKHMQAYLFWFFASGFLWPWLIGKGILAAVLPGAPLNASWARAALWTMLVVMATWMISARLHSVLDTPFKKTNPVRRRKLALVRFRKAWREIKGLFLWPFALYFVLCWLSGTLGADAVWRSRLPLTLLVALAYLLADFSGLALKNILSEGPRTLWIWLRFFWFWGLAWETVLRVAWAHYAAIPFDFAQAPHLLLSPIISLLTLLNSGLILQVEGALWQLIFALFIGLGATFFFFQPQKNVVLQAPFALPVESSKRPSFFLKFLTTLWRAVWFAPGWILKFLFWPVKVFFVAVYHQIVRFVKAAQPFLDRQAEELSRWADDIDNPILSRALRVKRDEKLSSSWLYIFAFQVVALLLLLGIALIKPVALLFYGANASNKQAAFELLHWRGWGDVVFGVALVFGLFINWGALFSRNKVFDSERTNGGMVFLFLTPLSEREIIGGHFGAALLPAVWLQSAMYPVVIFAFLLEIIAGRLNVLPLLVLLLVLLHTFFVLSANTSVWCAVRAKNSGEGGAWAIFIGLLPQAILLGALLLLISSTQGLWVLFCAAFCIALGALAAFLFWLDAVRRLRRERYGDISLRGTVAN